MLKYDIIYNNGKEERKVFVVKFAIAKTKTFLLKMIKIENITKIYNGKDKNVQVVALSNVSFEIKQGEFVGIVGRSGCGKSTLLNIIGTLDYPTEGAVICEGVNITNLKEEERAKFRNKNIGFVFQSFYLDKSFTILENITMPLLLGGVAKKERDKIGMEMLEKFGIAEKAKAFPHELSGGQMQRVAIARALINNPKIVLADEPTGNLDSWNGKLVMQALRDLVKSGTTVILVTHNQEDVKECDRIIKLADGKIVTDDEYEQAENSNINDENSNNASFEQTENVD